MRATQRLRDLERGLSAKQIVLGFLQEAQRYGSMPEHAEAILAAGLPPARTLCEQIESAVEETSRGQKPAAKNRILRAAQRDGLFLFRLAQLCNTRLLECARERRLEAALLSAGLALCVHEARKRKGLDRLSGWQEAAGMMLHDRRAELEAVRIIERVYFDGTPVLYPGEEARFMEQLRQVEELGARFAALGEKVSEKSAAKKKARRPAHTGRGAAADVPAAARAQAESLVMTARVRTLDEVNETGEATRVLLRHLGQHGLSGSSRSPSSHASN